ncbi:MAG: NUDIX hydrolase [Ktedonobacteraceae bacterium]|nr:NUDIX hydrolase [Ktedonobacteraceae bacterium]
MPTSTLNNAVVASDIVLLRQNGQRIEFLAVLTEKEAFGGKPAIPGGKLEDEKDETVKATALRETWEETHLILDPDYLKLIDVYSEIDRDPRYRSIAAAFLYTKFLSYEESLHAQAGDDASDLLWLPITEPHDLAFDHAKILQDALELMERYML